MKKLLILGVVAFGIAGRSTIVIAEFPSLTLEAPLTIVSSTKFPVPYNQSMNKAQVFTRDQMVKEGVATFDDLFGYVTNVQEINVGGQRSVFFRGGGSNLTQFMVDGVSLRDVSSPANTPALNYIPISSIERIEFISANKGSLYGSYSSNGVISVVTDLQSTGNFTRINGTISDRQYSSGFTRGMRVGQTQINFTASQYLDQSHSDLADTSEIDAKHASQFGASLQHQVGSANILAQLQIFEGQDDLDNYIFFPSQKIDDPNRRLRYFQNRASLAANYSFDPTWTGKMSYFRFFTLRDDRNDPDSVSTVNEHYENIGGTDEIEANLHWTGIQNANWLFGLVWNREGTTIIDYPFSGVIEPISRVDVSQIRTAFYSSWDHQLGWFQYAASGRIDSSEKYRSATYSVGSRINLPDHTILSYSYSTGFNAPSLFQRFSSYGKSDLNPETSLSWEIGVSKQWQMIDFSANYFDTLVNNLISYDFQTEKYSNSAGANRYIGIELSAAIEKIGWLRRSAISYTHFDSSTGSGRSYSVPEYKWHLGTGFVYENWSLRTNMSVLGPRLDNSTGPTLVLPTYGVLNVSGTYAWSPNESVHLGVENVFNTRYEWITNYLAPGRTVKLGYQLQL